MSQRDLIYDIGAHTGEDTEFYLRKGFRVVAVEANPALCDKLREKFAAEVASGQLILLNCAIARADGEIDFYISDVMTVWSTISPEWVERGNKMGTKFRKVSVQAERFEHILARHGVPHYLKVDIEGADQFCIEGLAHNADRPAYISVESNKMKWRDLLAEFDRFEMLGYRRFKIVNQAYIQNQTLPRPTREGRDIDHSFKSGATGLFGLDLPGRWLTRSQAIAQYRWIFLRYKFFGDNTWGARIAIYIPWLRWKLIPGWYDTHAAHGDAEAATWHPAPSQN